LRRLAGPVCAVVKADAYGHGAVAVARALERSGEVYAIAVSLVEEAAELRGAGVRLPLLVMGPALGDAHEELVDLEATPLVSDLADLEAFAKLGRRRESPVSVHLKVDTGMSRLGLLPQSVLPAIRRARERGGVVIDGLATHLACADMDDPDDADCMTHAQLSRFRDVVAQGGGARPSFAVHAANSSAALRFPAARWDFVRPGLALYGGGPAAADHGLVPTTRLVSEIAQIRDVPAGASVSYNALWRAERPTRVAVLPIGYADGYPRRLSSEAEVLIHGRRCPVVGAVSMDLAIADISALGDAVQAGDEAVLLGSQADEHISLSEFAQRAGLIEHEVTCGLSKRVPRVYA
jgi:alanine racemase